MIKYCVYNKHSELSSELYDTREEAQQELDTLEYGLDAIIIEVND
jgi:hypothetical protein